MSITHLDSFLDGSLTDLVLERSLEIFPRDGILFRQGDRPTHLYVVNYGEVILSMPAGQREIRFRAGRRSLLGIPAMVNQEPHSMNAKAAGDTGVSRLDLEAFRALLEIEPRLEQAVLLTLAAEVQAIRRAISSLLSESGG